MSIQKKSYIRIAKYYNIYTSNQLQCFLNKCFLGPIKAVAFSPPPSSKNTGLLLSPNNIKYLCYKQPAPMFIILYILTNKDDFT